MPIDASIPANIQQFDLAKVIGSALELRKMQSEMQSQNTMRQLLSQPDAIDPSTGLPTSNTLAKISRVDPKAGAALAGQVSQIQERKIQGEHLQSETMAARQKADTEALSENIGLYDSELKSGNVSPEIANQNLKKRLRDHIMDQPVSEDEKQKAWERVGAMTPDQLRVLSTTSEQREKARTEDERIRHDKATEGMADKRLTEGKQQILTDPKTNEQYVYDMATRKATTLDGRPYTPQGAQKIGGGAGVRSGIGLALQKYMSENPRANASDIADFAAQYTAGVREQGAVGSKRGQIEFSAAEVDEAAKVSKEAYSHLHRGQFLPFNKLRDAVERETSSPEQAAAFAADNALVNGYGALASRGGVSTVSAQDHARAMLNTAQSPEAHDAVVDKMITEGQALSRGGDEATRIARSHHLEMSPSGSSSASKVKSSGGVFEPQNKADFDSLDSKAHYRKPGDPPGTYRVKP